MRKVLKRELRKARNSIKKEQFHPAIIFSDKNPKDVVSQFGVLDALHSIIHTDPARQLHFDCPEWESNESYINAIEVADASTMPTEWLTEKVRSISGGTGVPKADGDVYRAIQTNPDKYECLVSFVDVLKALIDLGLLNKKEESIKARVKEN